MVHDDMVKVMITFIDALRREGILIEDSKSGLMKSNMVGHLQNILHIT